VCLWQCLAELWGSECMRHGKVECACVSCVGCVKSKMVVSGLCMCECTAFFSFLECHRLGGVWLFGDSGGILT